jgi:hypothetical protein
MEIEKSNHKPCQYGRSRTYSPQLLEIFQAYISTTLAKKLQHNL